MGKELGKLQGALKNFFIEEVIPDIKNNEVEIGAITPLGETRRGEKLGEVPQWLRCLWQYGVFLHRKFEQEVRDYTLIELSSKLLKGEISQEEFIDKERFQDLYLAERSRWIIYFSELSIRSEIVSGLFWLFLKIEINFSCLVCLDPDFGVYEDLGGEDFSTAPRNKPPIVMNLNAKA